jgi:anti-sigma B factor antagonist
MRNMDHLVHEGTHTLAIKGEVDLPVAAKLEHEVRLICAAPARHIMLDLREVTFMDSSGLKATLSTLKLCRRHGLGLSILPGPPQVHSLFQITGLAELLPFQTDEEQVNVPNEGILPKLFAPTDLHSDGR